MFVCEIVADQTVEAYSSMGRVIVLYVCMSVSFCWPHLVDVSPLRMLIVLLALLQMSLMCWVYVCCVSMVTHRILLWLDVVSGVLLI